jgi:hypothetical protein
MFEKWSFDRKLNLKNSQLTEMPFDREVFSKNGHRTLVEKSELNCSIQTICF